MIVPTHFSVVSRARSKRRLASTYHRRAAGQRNCVDRCHADRVTRPGIARQCSGRVLASVCFRQGCQASARPAPACAHVGDERMFGIQRPLRETQSRRPGSPGAHRVTEEQVDVPAQLKSGNRVRMIGRYAASNRRAPDRSPALPRHSCPTRDGGARSALTSVQAKAAPGPSGSHECGPSRSASLPRSQPSQPNQRQPEFVQAVRHRRIVGAARCNPRCQRLFVRAEGV